MNRRKFLRYSTLTAAGFAGLWMAGEWLYGEDGLPYEELISQLDLACQPGTGSVIIIGSGFAGLAAARTLHDLGYTVTVLEARERVGGRAYTRHDLGFPIDMGASWIHGVDGNPITHLVKQYDFTLTPPTNYNSIALYDLDGRYINRLKLLRPLWQFEYQMSSLEEAVATLEVDQSIYDALNELDPLNGFEGRRRRILNYMYYGSYQQSASTEPKVMSAFDVLAGDPGEGEDLAIAVGEEHWIAEGVGAVTEMLAQGVNIKLSHIVNSIDYSDPAQVVVYTDEAEFVADRCIVTVPLGVLKKGNITFTPALPQTIQNSIEKLIMGRFFKLAMTFPTIFWNESSHMIGSIGQETDDFGSGGHVIFFNLVPKLEKLGLVMFAGGDYAAKLEKMSPVEALAIGMARLRLLYGEEIPEPEHFLVSDWGTSPYTCGAYSGLGVGATDDDLRAFETVIDNRVTFAGEHTIPEYSATIHGAYISGLKAAKRVCDLF